MLTAKKIINLVKISTAFILSSFLLLSIAGCGNKVMASMLAVSDIHFSPFGSCVNGSYPCKLIQQLQSAPAAEWASILEQYDTASPSQAGHDSNVALLNSTLNAMKALPDNYRFVLLTGDLLAHNYQQKFQQTTGDKSLQDYQQFVNKTYQYLQLQLQQAFPHTSVFIALGNNDSYDGNYYSNPNGQFYKNLAQTWQNLILDPNDRMAFEQTFPKAGYYAITLPTKTKKTNKIIFLNTVLFSAVAIGPNIQTAAQQELDWLQQQLQAAKQAKQHVWLVYHIPNGVDAYYTISKQATTMLWQPQYNEAFFKILNQYPGTIAGLITAHIHMDGAELIHLRNRGRLTDTFIPSVSPIYGNNPAFKVYNYNPLSLRLNNYQTYYLNLPNSSWALEYDFNKIYQPYCHPCRLLNGYSTINQTGWRAERYQKYYAVSTDSQYITQGYWLPYYWCALQHQTKKGYEQCVKAVNTTNKKQNNA